MFIFYGLRRFPFSLARTNSPKMKAVLRTWPEAPTAAEQQRLGFTLLVELLAYRPGHYPIPSMDIHVAKWSTLVPEL